ncbi:hypothetical protein VCRA2110O318_60059 [Vibrio crassostreae]|nr:hypothetical protein VCRA2117O328_70059 [Vibrio crassostreae]CAK2348151.1 hypothetical protein VCRA2110O318_60059 [Vibrio crassostreae]CAK2526291.1 hypothetical protein VCRA2110O319_70170 [Vibrio crassostreae]CAK2987781.1 hypothetical protein VCRA217O317_60171 [Vibrio crassostreae]
MKLIHKLSWITHNNHYAIADSHGYLWSTPNSSPYFLILPRSF